MRPNFLKSLILLWICHFSVDFFTGLWPIYKNLLSLDLVMAGLLAGLSGCIGELFQLFFGFFSDNGHRKKILILGILLASSFLWVIHVNTPFLYFCLLLVLSLGSSAFHPAAAGFASTLSSDRKGFTILFFASGGAVGLGFSQVIFSRCLAYQEFPFILCFSLGLLLIIVARHPFPSQPPRASLSLRAFFSPLLRQSRPLLFLYFAQITNCTLATSFIFLLPELMQAKGGSPWVHLGGGHLAFILGSAAMMIPAGYFSDRYGQKAVLLTLLPLACLALYGFLSTPSNSTPLILGFLILLGGLIGTINPIILSWGNRLVPESPSTVSSLLMGCAWGVGNLGPIWAGLLVRSFETEAILSTLYCMGGLLAVSFFFTVIAASQPVIQAVRENGQDPEIPS